MHFKSTPNEITTHFDLYRVKRNPSNTEFSFARKKFIMHGKVKQIDKTCNVASFLITATDFFYKILVFKVSREFHGATLAGKT